MDDDLKGRYRECQELIEEGDYIDFVEKFSIFQQQSNDQEFQRILIKKLVKKLKDQCNDIKNELDTIDLNQFNLERICSLNNNYTKTKFAFDNCSNLIPNDDLNEEKSLIETEISKKVKKIFFSFIKRKNVEFKFCEKFWKNLNSLIGINAVDEINNQVLKILKDLNLDIQLAENITDSILQKGINKALEESQDDIPPKDYGKFKEKINLIFHTNQTSNEYISGVLKELRITVNDGLHQRIIDSVLSKGLKSLNSFRESISKNNLNKLIQKLDMYFSNNPVDNWEVIDKKKSEILGILKEVKIPNENGLHERVVNFALKNGTEKLDVQFQDVISKKMLSKLENKLSSLFTKDQNEINENKVNEVIAEILNECSIDIILKDKIINKIIEKGIDTVKEFQDDLPLKNFWNLIDRLKSNEILNWWFKNKKVNDIYQSLELSVSKFDLEEKIDFNKFNSMEGYTKSAFDIIQEICKDFSNYAEFSSSIFKLMMYLIKRQQSLKFFIKEVNFCLKKKQQKLCSLRELVYNLLLNCNADVRTKIFQLLHSTNPVPFLSHFLAPEKSLSLNFHPETYWLHEDFGNKKILSFSFDSECKGKTRLINSMFFTNFEESFKDSPFFQESIDLQLVKSFGSQENNLFICDSHGIMKTDILEKLCGVFDFFIVHIQEDMLRSNDLIRDFISKTDKIVLVIIRDLKSEILTSECTSKQEILIRYSENFQKDFESERIHLCRLPELNNRDLDPEDFVRTLRSYILQEILSKILINETNENILDLYKKEDKEKIVKVKEEVQPLILKLEDAIKNEGIKQSGFFTLYPIYNDINMKNYQLGKLSSLSNNNKEFHNLKIESSKSKMHFDNLNRELSQRSGIGIVYEYFIKLFGSNDFVLMIDFLSKKLNKILHRELKKSRKEKEELIKELRKIDLQTDTKDEKKIEAQLNRLNLSIDKKRISIEIIWREMILVFNCLKNSQSNRNDFLVIGKRYSELIFNSFPFEILDGDNFKFNKEFLEFLFELKQQRIKVISILGPQNSGKSTLLNFMFGCDFTVSDGRCTRGIYGSLIKSNSDDFDYYLILDTEGLQSIEKGDKEFDRKLILFCFAVSNILIINTKDQITDDVKTTLEICVDSLTKIEAARVEKPSVYFVMNQKADPNRKTDQDAINRIITNFTANGLITQLRLEESNFDTLPSAFNSSIIKFNYSESSFRRFETSSEFTDRVLKFTNNIIDQINKINNDGIFSNIYKWIVNSNIIFDTINMYPDLTLFKDIEEKIQEKKLQDFLNTNISNNYTNKVKGIIFNEVEIIQSNAEAETYLEISLSRIKQKLLEDFENYLKTNSVSQNIRELKKKHLVSQIDQIEHFWKQSLRIKKREKDLRRTINSGEGIINERVNFLLRSGKNYNEEDAKNEFERLFAQMLEEIEKNVNESIKNKDSYFNLIYTIYSSLCRIPSKIEIHEQLHIRTPDLKSPLMPTNNRFVTNINLKQVIKEFKVINKEKFELLYEGCCVNILEAIDFINNNKQKKTTNELLLHLKNEYSLTFTNYTSCDPNIPIRLIDLKMIRMIQIDNYAPEEETKLKSSKILKSPIILYKAGKQKLIDLLDKLKIKKKKKLVEIWNNSSKNYSENEFSLIIRNYLSSKVISNNEWYLLFDESEFLKKIIEISNKISFKNEPDYELVQSISLELEKLFEEYNNDLNFFDLALSNEPKRCAHIIIFKKMFVLYSNINIDKAINETNVWKQKKDSLCKYFVSQLAPDQFKDQENAKQYLRLFSEITEKELVNKCNSLIITEIERIGKNFTRLKMLEKHDSTLISLSRDKLLSYVLDPTNFLLNDFQILWDDFEENINKEILLIQSKLSKYFDLLKVCMQTIYNHLLENRNSFDSFRANVIFRLVNDNCSNENLSRISASEINNSCYYKGLCASILLFDFITSRSIQEKYSVEDESFELDASVRNIFKEIRSNINDDLRFTLSLIEPLLSKISIDFIDLLLKNIVEQIDAYKNEFLSKEHTFFSLGFTKDKYTNRIKGCGTCCPCCGRSCDTEHFKVQTEIGSETNRHKCNRGHQFRGFNGFKLEHSNLPSFKICESMKDCDYIRLNQKIYQWNDFKKLYPKWDFDSTGSPIDWENKCAYIWSIIGEELCKRFSMTYSSVTYIEQNKIYEPIHFILVLDDSGSMNSNYKWNELMKSVSNFLKIRSREVSLNDLISVVYFSVRAHTVIASSKIYPELVDELPLPSFGGDTNYSAALQNVTEIIQKSATNERFGIVFMSDGMADYPGQEINHIKSKFLNSIYKFWAIGYGNCNFEILKKMLKELYGNEDNFKNPTEPIQLSNIYAEIARDDNILLSIE
ncbi:von Willebrand factor type A domain containing [Brachionus plicatilis]|uniref:von Willebrand factor type A domain containing n=1 Tax=Brachionus plicatilis TaxID=10195 RepID=A0A3M7R990_BRAPC|nr:von Willebrand factor type A domain containing [Brachionus plicatilis]